MEIVLTGLYGKALFGVRALVDFPPGPDARSTDAARKIAGYAVSHGYLKNALKYNDSGPEFRVVDHRVAVTLADRNNEDDLRHGGWRYEGAVSDLGEGGLDQRDLGGPGSLDQAAIDGYLQIILDSFQNAEYENLYSLYSERTRNTLPQGEKGKRLAQYQKIERLVIDPQRKPILAYGGSRGEGRTFFLYFPVTIFPRTGTEVGGLIGLLVFDEGDRCEVQNLWIEGLDS